MRSRRQGRLAEAALPVRLDRGGGLLVAEEGAGLDGLGHRGRDHVLTGGIVLLDATEDVAGEDAEDVGIVAHDAVHVVVLEEVG